MQPSETVDLKARVAALEAGAPPLENPIDPPPADKRYPTGVGDPMVGVPAGTVLATEGALTISRRGRYEGKRYNRVTIEADDYVSESVGGLHRLIMDLHFPSSAFEVFDTLVPEL